MRPLNQILQGMHPDHADLLEAQGAFSTEDHEEYQQFLDEQEADEGEF